MTAYILHARESHQMVWSLASTAITATMRSTILSLIVNREPNGERVQQ